jgi:CubicO group peptidase (beta-lactamase class C family)
MYTKILLSILIIVLWACKKEDATPSAPSASDFAATEQLVNTNISKYNGSVVILVSQNGKSIYSKSWGTFNPNTQQAIASATKWLSAAVIMSLVDDGKLSLNDTIGKFLPIFTQNKKGKITIRQCFSFTSGFPPESTEGFEDNRSLSLEESVNQIARNTKLISTTGSSFYYGGLSMHIVGRIAEVVSGKSWQQLFDEKIGTPCQMKVTYSPLNLKNPKIAGGAVTSANDYLNFLTMLMNKGTFGSKRVLSTNAVSEILKDQTAGAKIVYSPYPANIYSPTPTRNIRYGVGNWLDVVDNNGNIIENSSPGLYGTHPWIDQSHNTVGIIFTFSDFNIVHETNMQVREAIRKTLK